MEPDFTISIRMPITFGGYTGGCRQFDCRSETIAEAIGQLMQKHPKLAGHLIEPDNTLSPGIEVLVNEKIIFPWDPGYKLVPGDQVRISSIITGG